MIDDRRQTLDFRLRKGDGNYITKLGTMINFVTEGKKDSYIINYITIILPVHKKFRGESC